MPTTAQLTAKQSRFIQEYLVDGNGAGAAVRAGFSVKGASVAGTRLLRNVSVRAALQAHQAAEATRLCLRREDVLNGLLQSIETARFQGNPAAMIRGWSEIGRLMGFYAVETKRVEVSAGGQAQMARLERLSDAELVAIMEAGRATAT